MAAAAAPPQHQQAWWPGRMGAAFGPSFLCLVCLIYFIQVRKFSLWISISSRPSGPYLGGVHRSGTRKCQKFMLFVFDTTTITGHALRLVRSNLYHAWLPATASSSFQSMNQNLTNSLIFL